MLKNTLALNINTSLNKNIQLKSTSLLLPIVLGIVVFLISAIVILQNIPTSEIVFPKFTTLSYVSLILFVLLCFFGLWSSKLYFSFLIFVLIAFPAPVNDFFPGTYLGELNEKGTAIFPFITHIDIYILLGIAKFVLVTKTFSFKPSLIFLIVILTTFVSIFANFFNFKSFHDQLLLIQGLFQFRYLIELYILIAISNISKYKNNILLSFVGSILFLFIESVIYTKKMGLSNLQSGSLSNNVFASIVAAVLLFLIYTKKEYKHSLLINLSVYLAIIVSAIIILASGTRMAVLAFFISYFFIAFINTIKKASIVRLTKWAATIVLFIFLIMSFADHLPKRYNPHKITDKITIHEFSTDLTKFIKIEPSWETNSLISRLQLYTTSLKMLEENYLVGIGVGRWNIKKDDYGFKETLLLDSHNGYLSTLSQYGFLGLPLMFFIYLFPIITLYKHQKSKGKYNFLFYLALINLFIALSDFSNSAIFKHQIFALLAFNAICLIQKHKFLNEDETAAPIPSS